MRVFALTFLLLSLAPVSAHACLGMFMEKAQPSDADVLFEGTVSSYTLGPAGPVVGVTSGGIAKVSFTVTKTIRGPSKQSWSAVMRGDALPKNLAEFTRKFGKTMTVGLRNFGGKIDQTKLPKEFRGLFFVVDAACSMNGEDWLLRKPGAQ